jgi:hypothetical protein
MVSWEFNPAVLRSFRLKASAIWEMGSLRLKAAVIGKAGQARSELYPGIFLTTEENHGKPQSS